MLTIGKILVATLIVNSLCQELELDKDSKTLNFEGNKLIGELTEEDFSDYTELVNITFANNDITLVNSRMFENNNKLDVIDFSGNQRLEFPKEGPFLVATVRVLNLSNCHIEKIPVNALDELKGLKVLDLSENPVDFENSEAFDTMKHFPHRILVSGISRSGLVHLCQKAKHAKIVIEGNNPKIALSCSDALDESYLDNIFIEDHEESQIDKELENVDNPAEELKVQLQEDISEDELLPANDAEMMMGDDPSAVEGSGSDESSEEKNENKSEDKDIAPPEMIEAKSETVEEKQPETAEEKQEPDAKVAEKETIKTDDEANSPEKVDAVDASKKVEAAEKVVVVESEVSQIDDAAKEPEKIDTSNEEEKKDEEAPTEEKVSGKDSSDQITSIEENVEVIIDSRINVEEDNTDEEASQPAPPVLTEEETKSDDENQADVKQESDVAIPEDPKVDQQPNVKQDSEAEGPKVEGDVPKEVAETLDEASNSDKPKETPNDSTNKQEDDKDIASKIADGETQGRSLETDGKSVAESVDTKTGESTSTASSGGNVAVILVIGVVVVGAVGIGYKYWKSKKDSGSYAAANGDLQQEGRELQEIKVVEVSPEKTPLMKDTAAAKQPGPKMASVESLNDV